MKKIYLNSLLILMLGIGTTSNAKVLEKQPIPIRKGNELSERPKAPERIPIYCEYENGTLYFGFHYELGPVNVVVTNEDTGDQWQAILQTVGNATMNISEYAGCYHIEITTIYNKVYQGDFEI